MKNKLLLRTLAFMAPIAFAFSTYWIGGGDFERGDALAFTYALSVFVGAGLAAAIIPMMKDFE